MMRFRLPCVETSSTPSTWPAVMYRWRRRSSSVPAMHQQQRDVVRGQCLGAAAQQDVEVRVLEEPLLRLGEQERHRVGAAG